MEKLLDAPSFEAFQDHVGSSFTIEGSDGDELELAAVDTTRDVVDDWKRFSLVFQGSDALAQGTYRLSGDGFDSFHVAVGPNPSMVPETAAGSKPPTVEYEAVFNRHAPGRVTPGPAERGTSAEGLLTDGAGGVGLSAEAILGGVELFAGNFAPRGFMSCNGQQLPIAQNEALYSLLGTTYGGDGQQSFNLPDLRGRAPIGAGTGPGLTHRSLGERGGSETVSLTTDQLAPHTHGSDLELPVSSSEADVTTPVDNALAKQSRGSDPIYTSGDTDGSMHVEGEIESAGGGQPHENLSPYLALNYVICVNGMYPSRN